MPHFRCTGCGRRIDSPVVIGAGDCPHCGGDVIFDLHGERGERADGPQEPRPTRKGFLRRMFRR